MCGIATLHPHGSVGWERTLLVHFLWWSHQWDSFLTTLRLRVLYFFCWLAACSQPFRGSTWRLNLYLFSNSRTHKATIKNRRYKAQLNLVPQETRVKTKWIGEKSLKWLNWFEILKKHMYNRHGSLIFSTTLFFLAFWHSHLSAWT